MLKTCQVVDALLLVLGVRVGNMVKHLSVGIGTGALLSERLVFPDKERISLLSTPRLPAQAVGM